MQGKVAKYQQVCDNAITYFIHGADLLQLKADYKQVKTLWELSGFGWDEVLQITMAVKEVWEVYISVHSHFLITCLFTDNP
jgi:hypothetical protein